MRISSCKVTEEKSERTSAKGCQQCWTQDSIVSFHKRKLKIGRNFSFIRLIQGINTNDVTIKL